MNKKEKQKIEEIKKIFSGLECDFVMLKMYAEDAEKKRLALVDKISKLLENKNESI